MYSDQVSIVAVEPTRCLGTPITNRPYSSSNWHLHTAFQNPCPICITDMFSLLFYTFSLDSCLLSREDGKSHIPRGLVPVSKYYAVNWSYQSWKVSNIQRSQRSTYNDNGGMICRTYHDNSGTQLRILQCSFIVRYATWWRVTQHTNCDVSRSDETK